MLIKHWQQFSQQVLKRKIPHAIFSWRYLMPGQSDAVKLHRKVFLNAWPQLPRYVWCLIALYSYSLWYFFYAWQAIYSVWKKNSEALCQDARVSRGKQLADLFLLAFLHSSPPQFYYYYRLYCYAECDWLNFVYTHELPHWHNIMSPCMGKRSVQLMAHKHEFAIEMAKHGMPVVITKQFVKAGETLSDDEIFSTQSIFLKPEHGSRKTGCYELEYNHRNKQYRLNNEDGNACYDKNTIRSKINKSINEQNYLIQPLLYNHPELEKRCGCKPLITVRLITAVVENTTRVVSGVLEVPTCSGFNQVFSITIDIANGALKAFPRHIRPATDERQESLRKLIGFQLPHWDEVISTAKLAHKQLMDIATIGWDLAITEKGVKLLEGNINWGVAAHQMEDSTLIKQFQILVHQNN